MKKTAMDMARGVCLLALLAFLLPLNTLGQQAFMGQEDLRNVRVDDLTDEQIVLIREEITKQGLTDTEWQALALAQNLPAAEVSKLRNRLATAGTSGLVGSSTSSPTTTNQPKVEKASQRTVGFDLDDKHLQVFGATFFNDKKLSFEPSFNLATPTNYQLGPGDELLVDVWGASQRSFQLPVSKEGTVLVQGVGPVFVSGLTLEAAKDKITSRLSGIFSGIRANPPNTFVQVGLGEMRSIKVSIIGEVRAPGTYTLSAVSTVFNGLYLSGGPSYLGSLRNIKVLRGNREVATLDIYDFLTKGDQRANIRLRDQDVIVVNPYQSRVTFQGAVKRPAIYELKPGEKLAKALEYAGGLSDEAYGKRLRVARNTEDGKRIDNVTEEQLADFELQNGDIITVDKISLRFENRVSVRGAVFREGDYQLTDSLTVKGLLELADGIRPDAFTNRANIYRTGPDYSTEVLAFDLGKLLRGESSDIALQKEDVVQITSVHDLRESYALYIEGEVQNPGSYPFMRQMTLSDLLLQAGGFTESASEAGVEVARRIRDQQNGGEEIAKVFQFTLDKNLQLEAGGKDFVLEPFDRVYIRKSPGYSRQQSSWVGGEVTFPGRYVLTKKNERISDLIQRAGGTTAYSYLPGARLKRRYNGRYKDIGVNLEKIMAKPGGAADLFLADGDSLFLPVETQIVQLEGEVFRPVALQYDKAMKFRDYVSGAGGYGNEAFRKKAYITYANGASRQTRQLLFFRLRPKVQPGATIRVPRKPEKRAVTVQEALGWSSAVATLGLIVVNVINAIDNP